MEEKEKLEKRLYKLELIAIKSIPMIVAFGSIINMIFLYMGICIALFKYIFGLSIFTILFLYLSSYVFKFCSYHRMFIHYIFISWLTSVVDHYFRLPISDDKYFYLQFIIAGISLFIILYLYVKNNKRPIIKKD